jgi:hypothetical protein
VKEEGEDKRLADYLLGNLSETEQVRLEEEYLADRSAQNRLLIVEDELVDAYLQGHFAAAERERFEAGFLASPRGRRKLELAKSLMALAAERQEGESHSASAGKRSWLSSSVQWAFAAAVLAIVLALAWLNWSRIWHHSSSPNTASQNPGSVPAQGNSQPSTKPANPNSMPASKENPSLGSQLDNVVAVILSPAARDVKQFQHLNISHSSTLQVQIQLQLLRDNHPTYRVDLLDAKDSKEWSGHALKAETTASSKALTFKLPATLFDNGEYTFVVSADEDSASPIAEYPFLVRKE